MSITILIVDDEPDIREMIGEILADEGYRTVLAADAAEARARRAELRPDLVLLDVWMPDTDGITLLKEWRADPAPLCPVVMISGHGTVDAAVEATRFGASDFIEKPVSMARLLTTVRKVLAGDIAGARGDERIPDPLGRSAAIEALRERLDQLAAARTNVLIVGETGSGRSTLARWLHARGPNADLKAREIIGGTQPDSLQRLLDRGSDGAPATLIVERLEALSAAQAEALGTLLTQADGAGRVLAIAGPEIERRVAAGRFDNDLFHRLAESRLDVPALRQRREDIPELVRYISEQLPVRENLAYRPFPVAVQNLLRQHDWPGNLRELTNLIRRLLEVGSDDPVGVEEARALLQDGALDDADQVAAVHSPLFELPLREAREAFERQYLLARLRQAGGSVGQLAEAVEMERTHLYRKLRQLGIDPKQVQEED